MKDIFLKCLQTQGIINDSKYSKILIFQLTSYLIMNRYKRTKNDFLPFITFTYLIRVNVVFREIFKCGSL